MFRKVLIANRGEIALRILRTLKDMNIASVAVHSTADAEAMHVRLADERVCIGPPPARDSYLNTSALLAAAEMTGAEAIHPGVGFLSESSTFARMVEEHGLVFIGPKPAHIDVMGDKIRAKEEAKRLGLPCVPGSDGCLSHLEDPKELIPLIGFPMLLKATHGGGGKGMQVVTHAGELEEKLAIAKAEAKNNFGSDSMYAERYLTRPRHIEFQIISDGKNAVVLGERECSVQRRHQKIWEEAPAPGMPRELIRDFSKTIKKAMEDMGYVGAGTLEFLFEKDTFYFIEMNTRIQVEHPITEAITGVDLIKLQVEIAAGKPLALRQEDVQLKGHAIECRINAEDPVTFTPSPGKVEAYLPPGGPHVRVDSPLYPGYRIPPYYDSLVSKLIAHGDTREACLAHLRRALAEYVITGPRTLLPLHRRLADAAAIKEGTYHIHWLEQWLSDDSEAA
jgi:acetyl-CoA carboxylase biotin carboxylase subunit